MVSDAEIISTVLEFVALVNRGERSIQLAGAECFKRLFELSKQPKPLPPDDGA